MRIETVGNRLVISAGASQVWVEPWGESSLRVRMTNEPIDERENCVKIYTETVDTTDPWYKSEEYSHYHQTGTNYYLTNGKITAKVDHEGKISFFNSRGELLTEEYWRNRNRINRYCVPLRVDARELICHVGSSDYELFARFEAFDDEKIFGMGQYQERNLDKKGAFLELAHRNSQASVPFYISSRGYGFLWNNPAIGTVAFGTN